MLWACDVLNILEYKPNLLTINRRTDRESCIPGRKRCQLRDSSVEGSCVRKIEVGCPEVEIKLATIGIVSISCINSSVAS